MVVERYWPPAVGSPETVPGDDSGALLPENALRVCAEIFCAFLPNLISGAPTIRLPRRHARKRFWNAEPDRFRGLDLRFTTIWNFWELHRQLVYLGAPQEALGRMRRCCRPEASAGYLWSRGRADARQPGSLESTFFARGQQMINAQWCLFQSGKSGPPLRRAVRSVGRWCRRGSLQAPLRS
jgi:hypothetical protein